MRKLVIYDIYWGIISRWKKYMIAFFVMLGITIIFIRKNQFYYDLNQLTDMPGFLDCLMNMFHGMKKYISDSKVQFEIPVEWMFYNLLIAFMIGNYMIEDLEKCGVNIITRVQSRQKWMISKILWNIFTVLSFYLVIYAANIIVSLIVNGELHMDLTESVCRKFFDIYEFNVTWGQSVFAIFVLPILSSLAISQLQMFLSIFVKPVVSFLMIASMLILSAYTTSIFLIGNYSMVQRSELFMQDGVGVLIAITVNLAIFVVSMLGSILCFKNKNII